MELTKLHNSLGGLIPMLNAQRQNWRSPTLCGTHSTLCCHSEWVPLRCRSSRAWPYVVLVVRNFWWPGMTNQVQKSIRSCMCCLQHEGNLSKTPLHPIVLMAAMDLLHVDFTNIEMTMEPNRLPKVANILVFQDHFTKHIRHTWPPIRPQRSSPSFCTGLHLYLWSSGQVPKWSWCELHEQYYWRDVQTPWHKEVANHVLSPLDKWVGGEVSPNYHADDWEIGEKMKKPTGWAMWVEVVHAYNATPSAVMGYRPQYLMFGCQPRLPVNFYFSTLRSTDGPRWGICTRYVNKYIATVRDHLRTTL